MPEKAKRVVKAGYKRVKTSSGHAYYINERTGNRVKKATATRAAHGRVAHRKRRVVHHKRVVHRKRHVTRRH